MIDDKTTARTFRSTRPHRSAVLWVAIIALLLGTPGVSGASAPVAVSTQAEAQALTPSPAPATSSQLITVNASSAGSSYATLSAWQKGAGGNWVRVFGPVAARVGGNGIGHASEGSSYTPLGTFPLNVAFGRLANPGSSMPYFRTDPLDWWDENPASPTYNRHVRRASSPGGASENLYYSGSAYNYAVNIGYNLNRVPGAGSAFFLHVNTGSSTAGCVSIDQGTLGSILRWLNPAQHPYIDIRVGAPLNPTPALTSGQAQKGVGTLYRTILGRAADTRGLAVYGGRLMKGATVSSVAADLVRSVEYDQHVATTAFRRCLGRDPGGATSYTQWLQAGATLSDLYAKLCGSAESWARAGKNGPRWLALVYPAALGRAPNSAATMWLPVLARSGPVVAMKGIASSREFGIHQLDLLYRTMLGRPVASSSINAYAALMQGRGIFTMPPIVSGGIEFWAYSQR